MLQKTLPLLPPIPATNIYLLYLAFQYSWAYTYVSLSHYPLNLTYTTLLTYFTPQKLRLYTTLDEDTATGLRTANCSTKLVRGGFVVTTRRSVESTRLQFSLGRKLRLEVYTRLGRTYFYRNFLNLQKYPDLRLQKKRFYLLQRIPINQRSLEKQNLRVFYKKKKFFLRLFLNVNKPTLLLFRYSRQAHWSIYKAWHTVREHRYKVFLAKLLRKPYIANPANICNYLFLSTQVQLSWSTLQLFTKYYTHIYMSGKSYFGNTGLLIAMPCNLQLNQIAQQMQQYIKDLRLKLRKWSYLRFKSTVYPWLSRKKNWPKYLTKLTTNWRFYYNQVQFDYTTGVLLVVKALPHNQRLPVDYLSVNALLKIYALHYRPQ